MKKQKNAIVIGGGLAGLIASISLAQMHIPTIVIEKRTYPFHRVCGEYISNEVKDYLVKNKLFPAEHDIKEIDNFILSNEQGKAARCQMQIGGFGISRYTLDHFLYEKAKLNGVVFIHDTASSFSFDGDFFTVQLLSGEALQCSLLLGAFGKRSNLDRTMERSFFSRHSAYMGIKWHLKTEWPADAVGLHYFEGGYAGVSCVEGDKVNFCYLLQQDLFSEYGSIDKLEEQHLSRNPALKAVLENSQRLFNKPLVISQVNFSSKKTVENHLLMCGDAAGLIHPLCGNGMAMAIQAGAIAAREGARFLQGSISREEMERTYQKQWERAFNRRLIFGRYAQRLMESPKAFSLALQVAMRSPYLLKKTVGLSHGKPFL